MINLGFIHPRSAFQLLLATVLVSPHLDAFAKRIHLEVGNANSELRCPNGGFQFRRPANGEQTWRGDEFGVKRTFRVAIWGDSHSASESFMNGVKAGFGVDPSSALPTFISANLAVKGVTLPLKSACASPEWRTQLAHRKTRDSNNTGLPFTSLKSEQEGSYLWIDFRWPSALKKLKSVDLLIQKDDPDRTLMIGVSADNGPEKLVALERDTKQILEISSTTALSTLQLRLIAGQISIGGFAPHYEASIRASFDNFSIPGATIHTWINANTAKEIFEATGLSDYDLVVLQYGTNEASDISLRDVSYRDMLRTGLTNFRRIYSNTPCVLIGPPDRGFVGKSNVDAAGNSLSRSLTHKKIAQLQFEISREFGCSFWDWQAYMGGVGSALQWEREKPPLMQPDLLHLTARGYERSGRAFAHSMLRFGDFSRTKK